MKILAIGASSSRQSINRKLATYAASLVTGAQSLVLDSTLLDMPLYSIDRQTNDGFPESAQLILSHIHEADAVIISLAEHNHSYTAAFKNLIDWLSRMERKFLLDKPLLLLSTSPGGRGGANVMAQALKFFPYTGAKVVGSFTLPKFNDHFQDGQVIDDELRLQLHQEVSKLTTSN
ncbi:MAG: NAD(P)H-dependent oxidoreductase [Saprospiraceae bacterium]|nr:NAD(P)H-dependent oxidoreductase [Saprospiraceae bacterium]